MLQYERIGSSKMLGDIWLLIKQSVSAFIDDEALTRGAAIAFYTVTSIGPLSDQFCLLWSPLPVSFSVKTPPGGLAFSPKCSKR